MKFIFALEKQKRGFIKHAMKLQIRHCTSPGSNVRFEKNGGSLIIEFNEILARKKTRSPEVSQE